MYMYNWIILLYTWTKAILQLFFPIWVSWFNFLIVGEGEGDRVKLCMGRHFLTHEAFNPFKYHTIMQMIAIV